MNCPTVRMCCVPISHTLQPLPIWVQMLMLCMLLVPLGRNEHVS